MSVGVLCRVTHDIAVNNGLQTSRCLRTSTSLCSSMSLESVVTVPKTRGRDTSKPPQVSSSFTVAKPLGQSYSQALIYVNTVSSSPISQKQTVYTTIRNLMKLAGIFLGYIKLSFPKTIPCGKFQRNNKPFKCGSFFYIFCLFI